MQANQRNFRVKNVLLFGVPLTLFWFKEFSEPDGFANQIYSKVAGPLRAIDLIVIAFFGCTLILMLARGKSVKLNLPKGLKIWSIAFLLSLIGSLFIGFLNGGKELFFDWRNIALGMIFARGIWHLLTITHDPQAAFFAVCIVVAAKGTWLLANYFRGLSDIYIRDVRIPVYDGATLTGSVFIPLGTAALLFTTKFKGWARLLLLFAGLISSILVVLSFRRSFWAELLLGSAILLLAQKRGRTKLLTLVVGVAAFAFLQIGPVLGSRLASTNPFNTTNPYGFTNQDHINDILDAFDVVRQNPIGGIGQGKPYKTSRVSSWKTESWGVHNAPLHVWLRYGLLGIVAYLGIHVSLFDWLRRLFKRLPSGSVERALILGILSFMLALFLVSCSFAPWPYGSLQINIVTFTILAIALYTQRSLPSPRQRSRMSGDRPSFESSHARLTNDIPAEPRIAGELV